MRATPRMLALALLVAMTPLMKAQDVLTEQNIFDLSRVLEVKVSPDARHIAYTVLEPRPFSEVPGSDYRTLHVLDRSTGTSRTYIGGKKLIYDIGWSRDAAMITFRANFDDIAGTQVYGIRLDGGEAFPLTESPTGVRTYSLRPDGGAIAYVATEPADPARQGLERKGFNAEVYEELNPDLNIYIRSLRDGSVQRMTENVSAYDLAWSPDGRSIAAAIAPENLVDHSYMFKRIHLLDPESGSLTRIVDNPGKLGAFAWSPDSRKLAFISAVAVWDSKEGSVFVTDVTEAKPFSALRNFSQGYEGTVTDIAWKDAGTLLFAAEEGVETTLREQPLDAPSSSVLVKPGTFVFRNFSRAEGVIAFSASTAQHPSELYTFSQQRMERQTVSNPWLTDIRFARQESYSYQARDGLNITSVLVYPLNYEPGKKYPLIVDIHGGPESAYHNGWVTSYGNWGQVAAARGYFVFMPNYRASTGRGVAFSKMGLGDLAGKEFTDVLDGIDALVENGFVDEKRVGIGGGSYGGYFSAWAATRHSARFAASVVFVGVSNQISKRNTTDIPYEDYYVHWGIWTHEDVEKVWDRSPVKWALGSTTPTLILHGKDDPRVHPSQSLELYRSLKLHGEAPVRLVWYPGEGHGNRRNPARLDYIMRTMDWFDHYLQGDGQGMPPAEL
ncbi:MAG: S9 family peptidase, partial [Bacteroidota bacterium]|nr:S9 family peptidase [Bacteroidota bacterium]